MSTFLAQTIINLGAAVLSYYLIDDEIGFTIDVAISK